MRKTTLTVGMLLAFVAACGTTTTAAPTAPAPSASAPATTVTATASADAKGTSPADASDKDTAKGTSGTSDAGSPQRMGTTQVIKTADFEAEVTAVEVKEQPGGEELGDPAYVIETRVQVIRGTYPAGMLQVQLVFANGTATDPFDDTNGFAPAAVIDAPDDATFRHPFSNPAVAGIGEGARITIREDGKLLATWLT